MFTSGIIKTLWRPLVLKKRALDLFISKYHTARSSELSRHAIPIFIQSNIYLASATAKTNITFAPKNVNVDFNFPRNNNLIKNIMEFPILPNLKINDPQSIVIIKSDIVPEKSIELPTMDNIIEKQAVRMIIIRRQKMKKHKLKKLHKKRAKIIMRVRQLLNYRKEKKFLAEMVAQVREAEKFDAKKYVASRINELTEVRLPKYWKGVMLPQYVIKEFMKEEERKKKAKAALPDLTKYKDCTFK